MIALLTATAAIVLAALMMDHLGWAPLNPPASGSIKAPTQPARIETEETLSQYLRSQPDWLNVPTVFPTRLSIALERQATPDHPAAVRLEASGSDLDAQSVDDVSENGTTIAGVVVIVGRVRSASTSPVIWAPNGTVANGPDHNTVLESPDRKTVIFGLIAGNLKPGQVVYFPGVVVAVGYALNGTATAYVVSLSAAVTRSPTSGAIKVLINAYLLRVERKRRT